MVAARKPWWNMLVSVNPILSNHCVLQEKINDFCDNVSVNPILSNHCVAKEEQVGDIIKCLSQSDSI